jgi:hypothetical protein
MQISRNISAAESSEKKTNFAEKFIVKKNGFKMWYSWSSECGKINPF